MPTDIFPNIDIPVVTVVWYYGGLSADQIANRITTNAERGMTTTVNDIDHIESQSLVGVGIIKIFFHPNVNIGQAMAQVTAISQVQLRSLPPGTTPPFIIQYNASSVPVLQLGLSGPGLNETQLNDLATNTIRIQLATVEGAQTPFPFGGKQRQIEVDLDLNALEARGLSPADVVNAITAQNVIAPSGTIKLDRFEYQVETNSAPRLLDALNDMPIKTVNGAVVYIRDVAHVRDGNPPQTNIVRVDGRRAIMMNVLKTGSTSTLDIIKNVRRIISSPSLKGQLPPQLKVVAARRSVDLRARRHQRRGARGHHRGLPDRGDDPDLPGQLAVDDHHRRLHSALDSLFAHPALRAARNHQHHDPGRHGAGRGHPGGRRHRGHREHQPLSGDGTRAGGGHPRRLGADCHARPSSRPSPSASSSCPCSS